MIYKYLNKLLADRNDLTIFEIGAHIGTDTIKLYKYSVEGLFVCFEPDARNLRRLKIFQDSLEIRVVPKAVGKMSGSIIFYQSSGYKCGVRREITDLSSTKKPRNVLKKHHWAKFSETIVECISLDDFCRENDINFVDFIWVDVQGAELDVIQGAENILKNTRFLYFECMRKEPNLYYGQSNILEILDGLPRYKILFSTDTDTLVSL